LTLAASLVLAVALPGTAQAQLSQAQNHAYYVAYAHVVQVFGQRAAGCKLMGAQRTCHGRMTDQQVLNSTDVLHRIVAAQPIASPASSVSSTSSTPAPSYSSSSSSVSYGGGYSNVPGVPASFAACVAMRESTNGAGSSNIYGIEGPGGQGSLAEQKQAFASMYAARGTEPWSPYDGC
jgi:hypothetical protein